MAWQGSLKCSRERKKRRQARPKARREGVRRTMQRREKEDENIENSSQWEKACKKGESGRERTKMRNAERQIRQTLHFARAYPEEHPRSGVQELPEAGAAADDAAVAVASWLVPAISAKLEEKGSIRLRETRLVRGRGEMGGSRG